MACTVADLVRILNQWAPEETAEPWDHVGLQIGSATQLVTSVLVSLDATPAVAAEAVAKGAQLVVCHHPRIFSPLHNLLSDDPEAAAALAFAKAGVSLYVMHTNLDRATGGVNDALAEAAGIIAAKPIANGFACLGNLAQPMTLKQWAQYAGDRLGAPVWFSGHADMMITSAASAAGAGAGALVEAQKLGAQAMLTGEVKHHEALLARQIGIGLLMAGHDASELPVVAKIANHLQKELAALQLMYNVGIIYSEESVPLWRCCHQG